MVVAQKILSWEITNLGCELYLVRTYVMHQRLTFPTTQAMGVGARIDVVLINT